ncbi:uncharacterized protein LOC141719370 [Apium graveolens]|uniref:uncharacterized protein LOC141719370 n=1 Tax=Apium graveolens TaxID=4045 RepID=UPI003D7C00E8
MAYGTEALIPVEVGLESYRTEAYNVEANNFGLRANTAQHYDSNIKKRSFGVGDLVLRELVASMLAKQGKFQPNWEGPYKVIEVVRPGTYKLETLTGEAIKNTWHASRLQ